MIAAMSAILNPPESGLDRSIAGHDHIVDLLIKERAPRLSSSLLWPLVRPALYAALDYRKARAMADALAPMGGREALGYVSRLLGLRVTARGLDQVPREGGQILIVNHPTGLADGAARPGGRRNWRKTAGRAGPDAARHRPPRRRPGRSGD